MVGGSTFSTDSTRLVLVLQLCVSACVLIIPCGTRNLEHAPTNPDRCIQNCIFPPRKNQQHQNHQLQKIDWTLLTCPKKSIYNLYILFISLTTRSTKKNSRFFWYLVMNQMFQCGRQHRQFVKPKALILSRKNGWMFFSIAPL